MTQIKSATKSERKGTYGIDAPCLLPIPLALIAWNVAQGIISKAPGPFVAAGLVAACMACGLYTSRRGKFVVWGELLDQLNLQATSTSSTSDAAEEQFCCWQRNA